MILRLFFCGIVFCALITYGQSNISAEFVGLTIHPKGDPTAHLQPYKLDPEAKFVVNFGGVITYEKYIYSDLIAIKVLDALLADCSAGWANIFHVGVKGMVIRKPRHRFGFGLGPAFMVRESWTRFEDYQSSGFMNEGNSKILGPIQYKFFPLAVEMEYEYSVTNNTDLAFSITPGLPIAITMGFGVKYWFNKDFERKLHLPKIKQ